MRSLIYLKLVKIKLTALLVFAVFIGNAQTIQVNIFGGAQVNNGDIINIIAGESLEFQITNVDTEECDKLKIKNIYYTNYPTYYAYQSSGWWKIKPTGCQGNHDHLNFIVDNNSTNCTSGEDTIITIETKHGDFSFTIRSISGSPVISVSGGSPLASVTNGATITSDNNGTYFGVVESGNTVTHNFIITNTGSCTLTIPTSGITSVLSNFTIGTPLSLPLYTQLTYPFDIAPGASVVVPITFSVGTSTGSVTSTITILNNDTTFTFDVNAEVFNFTGPGPGGITANFRLWLKSTRGIVASASKVSEWKDLGSNGKNAIQAVSANQPTFYDDTTNNINFNPVVKFVNDGSTINQYLENTINGFYTQDIFLIMKPDTDVTTSSAITILSGTVSNYSNVNGSFVGNANYDNDGDSNMNDVDPNANLTDDATSLGLGNFNTRLTGERLWYNQGSISTNPYYTIEGSNTETYTSAGIINVHNKTTTESDGQSMIYNGIDQLIAPTSNIIFSNLGDGSSGTWLGTPYNIGKNLHDTFGNLNGRIAEIMTYATRVSDTDRLKIESYLAIKYGITLGLNGTSKDYYNSAGTVIWDIAANAGFNYNIAGIARDDASDLDQKQSKSINDTNEVTVYLGNIFTTNSANIHDFEFNLNSLMWGSNNGNFSADSVTSTLTIGTGYSSTITKINKEWKIVPTAGVGEDAGDIYITIPETALTTSFSKLASEEYALVVADNPSFDAASIIDVIPLRVNASGDLYTWYDFDTSVYFTFAKVPQVSSKGAINVGTTTFLVGESGLDLDIFNFTVSSWIRTTGTNTDPRTIMAKGDKIQIRLNASNQVEIIVDDVLNPVFTSTMTISDTKWHYLSFVYHSGTVFLYIDGVLDKSVQNIAAPTPNFKQFSIGALYNDDVYTNTFNGEIDEVTIFDYALTEQQVRYLMNQEIVETTGFKVSGKVIPEAAASNELSTLDWSKLKAYYNFNSFYGSTVEGLTDGHNFLRINYLNKGKSIVTPQTAPLPYVSAADGEWGTAATWLNSDKQNLPNSLGVDGTTMIDWNIVQTSHNITSGNKDISVLGLISTAGKLTIANTTDPQDETNAGQALDVSHYLELDGNINLVGESQLLQDEGSILDEDSGGYLERDQQGTANSFNFNYWTSSVGPISGDINARGTGISSTNANHSISEVLKDGTQNIIFSSSYSAADVGTTNPITLSSYWFYKFNGLDNDYNAWVSINENTALLPGEGYTMKGASGAATVTNNQNYIFKGKPTNGNITLAIAAGDDRLIGNPYPSALDADEFILDNIKDTINLNEGVNTVNIFNGALYFWHHFGQVDSHNLGEYIGGYATYTLMGGVQAYATDALINATGAAGNKVPERYIPVNQGFFVKASLDATLDSTTTTVSGGNIIFKNSQRVFVRESFTGINRGSLFFKSNVKSKTKETKNVGDSRPKIRLQFSSPQGYHRQLLLGADIRTTKNFDIGFDAPIADINKEDMYWVINNGKFVIQAVNNFNEDQEFPLGLKTFKDGLVTIKTDKLENVDPSLKIYIKDNLTNTTTLINEQPFKVNLLAGEYLDRFVLLFKSKIIVTEEEELISDKVNLNIQVFMNNDIEELQIKNVANTEIITINLFNDLGQRVNSWKGNSNALEYSIPIKQQMGVYIVQVIMKNSILNKKIIIN